MVNVKNLATNKQKDRRAAFVKKLVDSKTKFTIAANDAFVRSIQSIGYKSTGSAAAEIIDNSIEANASKVSIEIGYGDNKNQITELIFADNGFGMDDVTLRYAMTFGGTDREGSSDLFGRYGFGLPASCMSQGNVMTVYSKEPGKPIYELSFDLNACSKGEYTDKKTGDMLMPEATSIKALPKHLQKITDDDFGGFKSGTIVVMSDLNRHCLTNKSLNGLKTHLIHHLGATFHKYLDRISMSVCEEMVLAIDPTFSDPKGVAYDIGGSKADQLPSQEFTLTDEITGQKGKLRVSFAYLGPKFVSKEIDTTKVRGRIAREYNGFIISRNGRIIDCISRIPASIWPNAPKRPLVKVFQNNDAWFKVVLDFDASLDNLFSITTTKQQAMPKAEVWDILENSKMFFPMLSDLRKRSIEESDAIRDENDRSNDDGPRPSEIASAEASSFQNPLPVEEEHILKIGDEKVTEAAKKQLLDQNQELTEENIESKKKDITGEQTNKKRVFRHGTINVPGGDFVFISVFGNELRVDLNTAHVFYKDFYMNPSSNGDIRQYIEAFLMAFAERYYINDMNEAFYAREISFWSSMMNDSFAKLKKDLSKAS
jgi:hypothetical protein